jgi:hypothetical protein
LSSDIPDADPAPAWDHRELHYVLSFQKLGGAK